MKWCADLALSYNLSIPWIMCQEDDAPQPIVRIYYFFLIILFNYNYYYIIFFFFLFLFHRLTLAMDSTVISSNPTAKTVPKCGRRIGRAGIKSFYLIIYFKKIKIFLHLK